MYLLPYLSNRRPLFPFIPYIELVLLQRTGEPICRIVKTCLLQGIDRMNEKAALKLSSAIVVRFQRANSWDEAKRLMGILEKGITLNDGLVRRLLKAVEENYQVRDAFGVPDRVKALIRQKGF
jgi:hypothetical protein